MNELVATEPIVTILRSKKTRWEWADYITEAYRRGIESVLETGRRITEAKADLDHGEFINMVNEDLPFGPRSAQMFMTISNHPVLSNANHGSHLPVSWRTLYELTRLPTEFVEQQIESGNITPETTRGDVARWKREANLLNQPDPPPLPPGKYSVIYADPPWRYEHSKTISREIENKYPTMELEEICRFPVEELINDDAILFLWATSPKLEEALSVMEAWGFTYRTCMVWAKDKIGMGYYARQQHELLLIGRKGNMPAPEPGNRPSSILNAPRTKHSRKPTEFYSIIEGMYGEYPKLELFAREPRDGWRSWGNEHSN